MSTTTEQVLPPNLSASQFAQALRGFAAAVGAEHVLAGADLTEYADPYAFSDAGHAPSAVLLPQSVAEIQAILAVSNAYRVPLWPVSQGRNYAYGGAAPRVPGSVVLSLSRMNRVLAVDETCGSALLEPGVRFFDLHEHLRRNQIKLWASVPEIGWGSVVGNALERGFGYTPYGDHAQMQCGMEVVLANGELVRTGMGAQTDNAAWQLYKGGYGPSVDGLFMQSNFGIVTKMGLWLMPQPEWAIACSLTVRAEADLAPVIETIRPLLLDGTIQSSVQVGSALAVASMRSARGQWFAGPGPIPSAVTGQIAERLGLGWWNARFGLYGPRDLAEARLAVVQRACERIPGAELTTRSYPGDVEPAQVHPADRTLLGVPSMDAIRMAGWRGGDPAHTDFSLVCPPTGADAVRQMGLIKRRVEEFGFDYAGGFTLSNRHAIALCLISFDRGDAAERARVSALFRQLVLDAAQHGYAPYRSHLAFMDLIAEQYTFNHHAARRLNQTLKDALDPNGILAPGKQGIWPAADRKEQR